jgi:C4-dicarboxylate transporter, DctM subunit
MHDPILIAGAIFLLAFVIMALGVWIGYALLFAGLIGFALFGSSIDIASNVFFDSTNSLTLTAIPLYVFLGELLVMCGASTTIFNGASRLFGWVPGGLLHANIASCAVFASISGSSPATAATIGTASIPELNKRGYDKRLTYGSIAAGGTLGILIPPSINMIVYATVASASVGQLFIGGVVPGLLLTGMFMAYIAIRAVANPALAPRGGDRTSLRSIWTGLLELWPAYFLGLIVIGGIFSGLVTPTEAAALGSFAALLLAAAMGKLTWPNLKAVLANTIALSCMILIVYLGAMVLASFFGSMDIPGQIGQAINRMNIGPVTILLIICVLYLILGCFLDGISMIVLTVPTLMPVIHAAGFDKIWFGIFVVVLCEIGMITPPMGLNLFVVKGISRDSLREVTLGSLPFFGVMILFLLLITTLPDIVLWLPLLAVK